MARNQPGHKVQSAKGQNEPFQAEAGTQPAKPDNAGRQAAKTRHEAGTSTSRHKTSETRKPLRHVSAPTQESLWEDLEKLPRDLQFSDQSELH